MLLLASFIAGIIVGCVITLIASRQGSYLAARVYLGAFPPEPTILNPFEPSISTHLDDDGKTPDQAAAELADELLKDVTSPTAQEIFDLTFLHGDDSLAPQSASE